MIFFISRDPPWVQMILKIFFMEWVIDVNKYLGAYMGCNYVGFTGFIPLPNDESL